MDKKVELQVLNITNSQSQAGAFALLLGEVNGERQLPVIIGPAEAQATALFLKGVRTPRPLTHDLFIASLNALGVSLIRILIYKAQEGVFYSYLYMKNNEVLTRMDARTSDAIALAVRAGCPIMIYESILEEECIRMPGVEKKSPGETEHDNEEEKMEEESKQPRPPIHQSLEDALSQAIKNENYELAAKLRDQIKSQNKAR